MVADRESWLKDRMGSVGGSEAATVMGCNPYDTKLALYARKRRELPEKESTLPMQVGHHMESFIDERYKEETSRTTSNLGRFTIQRRGDCPSMHATLDRSIRPCDGHDMPGVLQCKNVGHRMASNWNTGDIPVPVQVQIQHEMFVSKMEWGSVAALLGGSEFVWQDVERYDRFCSALARECAAFMKAVRKGRPPKAEAGDLDVVRLLNPTAVPGREIDLPDEAIELTDRYDAYNEIVKGNERTLNGIKARLQQLVGDAELGKVPGDNGAWQCTTVNNMGSVTKPYSYRQLRRKK